jgi:hypothetical protein
VGDYRSENEEPRALVSQKKMDIFHGSRSLDPLAEI